MRRRHLRHNILLIASSLGLVGLVGCGRAASPSEALVVSLGLTDQTTYADVVPAENQVLIGPSERVDAARRSLGEEPVNGEAITLIDATGDRTFFPMPRDVRAFSDRRELDQFMIESFGVNEESEGLGGSYSVRGVPLFRDGATGIEYRVADPLLAYIAGAHGIVRIAGRDVCVDADGECGTDYASYLEPLVELLNVANPVAVVSGNNGVVMTFTSFFNKTWFPWPWARHGSNVGINFAPLPTTAFTTGGFLMGCTPGIPGCVSYDYSLPLESGSNVQSVESAHWLAAPDDSNRIWVAEAVCGFGQGNDPDVGLETRRTDNGPNATFRLTCPD